MLTLIDDDEEDHWIDRSLTASLYIHHYLWTCSSIYSNNGLSRTTIEWSVIRESLGRDPDLR